MKKQLIILLLFLAMLLIVPSVNAGYICDMCNGKGYYWIGDELHSEKIWCVTCGGDGCVENPSPANEWKDDGSCGGAEPISNTDSTDGSGSSDIIKTGSIEFYIILVCIIVGVIVFFWWSSKQDKKNK
jgi:hypothetical protein